MVLLAGVYDHSNGMTYLYIDGLLNDSAVVSGNFTSSTNNIRFNNIGDNGAEAIATRYGLRGQPWEPLHS